MPVIKFELGANVLQFSQNISLPVSRPTRKLQVIDRTAAMTPQREELGGSVETRNLFFRTMPKADYELLQDWIDNVADGMLNDFTFYDEHGNSMQVFCTSPVLDFKEFKEGWFTGTLPLEVV